MKAIDLTGTRFGRLTVIRCAGTRQGQRLWQCSCDCGNTKEIVGYSLRKGLTQSCGCLQAQETSKARRTHGKSATRTFKVWDAMLQRCTNPNSTHYDRYGGRGVAVCERWSVFANFLADMGEAPDGMSIDRIDNERGYEPENCAWATASQQARNKSSNVILEFAGERKCLQDWVGFNGLTRSTIRSRLARGWTTERALGTPIS